MQQVQAPIHILRARFEAVIYDKGSSELNSIVSLARSLVAGVNKRQYYYPEPVAGLEKNIALTSLVSGGWPI